ncbi:hypothetical protein JRO89_XS10G0116000 [Xanthoceras sorbifolium]|uniref:MOSC domain-containing protein n=1 Tax=Xanthoceras sorbifolium TaxID=99658 RepID=A0ABQ8HIB8_9ROSI|nr:hypothetical protein JRO89_XS10G0116000 [Xanthoceras sorbifolium]
MMIYAQALEKEADQDHVKIVCSRCVNDSRYEVDGYGDEVILWFGKAIGQLALCREVLAPNVKEGTYGAPVQVNPMRFRPNLVISGGEPYAEDGWRNLKIENQHFTSLGGCNRCQMINFDHKDEQVLKSNEPLATLASDRRAKGKILFGILLKNNSQEPDSDSYLEVGQEIHPNL